MSNLHKSPEALAVEQQWRKQAQEAEAATVHGGAPNIDVTEIDNLKVPTLPAATVLLIEMCHDINVSYPKLSRIIQTDPGLSVRIFRVTNSAYYAQSARESSIVRALTVLGLKEVRTIGLGYKLMNVIKDFVDDTFDFEAYWERSLFTAVMAREITSEMNGPLTDEAFLAGLLQDIGTLILRYNKPAEYKRVTDAAGKSPEVPLVTIEQQLLDTNHAKTGAAVCARWRFPQVLTEAIRYHHTPSQVIHGDHGNEIRAAAYAAVLLPEFLTATHPVQILDDLESRGVLQPGVLGPIFLRAHQAMEALQSLFEGHRTPDAQVTELMVSAADRFKKLGATQLEVCQPPE